MKLLKINRRSSKLILENSNKRRREDFLAKLPDVSYLKYLYEEKKIGLTQIAHQLKINCKLLKEYFIANNIKLRSRREVSLEMTQYYNFKSRRIWNKGLTKKDSRINNSSLKMMETKRIRGVTYKGKNNPMYGKISHSKVGFREDLGHSVRSSWEANFARILKYLKLDYVYEKQTFSLNSGKTYTPDFYIPKKDTFYEVKGYIRNNKHQEFIEQYPEKRLVLVNENFYKKLMTLFSSKIEVQDKIIKYTKKEIEVEFCRYCNSLTNKKPSVSYFCKKNKIGIKNISSIFGSCSNLVKTIESNGGFLCKV